MATAPTTWPSAAIIWRKLSPDLSSATPRVSDTVRTAIRTGMKGSCCRRSSAWAAFSARAENLRRQAGVSWRQRRLSQRPGANSRAEVIVLVGARQLHPDRHHRHAQLGAAMHLAGHGRIVEVDGHEGAVIVDREALLLHDAGVHLREDPTHGVVRTDVGVHRVGTAAQHLPADPRFRVGVQIADQPDAGVVTHQLGRRVPRVVVHEAVAALHMTTGIVLVQPSAIVAHASGADLSYGPRARAYSTDSGRICRYATRTTLPNPNAAEQAAPRNVDHR